VASAGFHSGTVANQKQEFELLLPVDLVLCVQNKIKTILNAQFPIMFINNLISKF
jgi:hypothetical protein